MLRKWIKVLFDQPVQVGSTVKFKEDIPKRTGFGEVIAILSDSHRLKYQIILLNNRMQPIMINHEQYKTRTLLASKCKHVMVNPSKMRSNDPQLGDVVLRKSIMNKKFGVITGFVHPDELLTTSYESGYNGVDLIQCVEVNRVGLTRKRRADGTLKRFTTTKNKIKLCDVDVWNPAGLKILY